MKLYHYSEDPALTVFHPHVAKTSLVQDQAYVWAIDEWHSPMYYVPRTVPGPASGPANERRRPIASTGSVVFGPAS